MSGKPKRRGRHLSRSQRRKLGGEVSAPVARTPAVAQKPAPSPRAAAPVSATRASAAKTALAQPPDISGELKRSGILGGLMVAILVALYFVLPSILN